VFRARLIGQQKGKWQLSMRDSVLEEWESIQLKPAAFKKKNEQWE